LPEKMDHSHSVVLDEVLKARHSIRSFSPVPLKKEEIEQIIRAGLIAPFASIAVIGKTDFRKFFIIPAGSPVKGKIKDLIVSRFPKYAEELEKEYGPTPFVKMLKGGGPNMAAGLLEKPCLVIGGERWGSPAIAPESLSYCFENMWLKATSLNVGFQLLTVIPGMKLGNDKEFCQLLGIPPGEYYLDGFALGYPAENYKPASVRYPDFESSVKWL
jgi:nitroreductase